MDLSLTFSIFRRRVVRHHIFFCYILLIRTTCFRSFLHRTPSMIDHLFFILSYQLFLIGIAASNKQFIANIAVPINQSTNDMASETEPVASEAASENYSFNVEETPNILEADIENLSISNELTLENPSSTDGISTSSRVGLLSLPPELRVLVLRHLLLENSPLSTVQLFAGFNLYPPILRTCVLIRREAFQVFYGENSFFIVHMHPPSPLLQNRQIRDTIQNVDYAVALNGSCGRRLDFIHVIRKFGLPAVVRGTLNLIFFVGPYGNNLRLWFARVLPRFTNFRTVQVRFLAQRVHRVAEAEALCLLMCDSYKDALTPAFGPAQSFADGHGLRFHPQQHLNSLTPESDVDWIDYLGGIRLIWNQDSPTINDEPEASAQNSNAEA